MLINGEPKTTIDINNRGLAYGDGVFSTIKIEYGQVQLWDLHLARLQRSAKKLFFPEINWHELTTEIKTFSASFSSQADHVIKIILVRGSGGRGYSIEECTQVDRIITAHHFPGQYQQWQLNGIAVIQCDYHLANNRNLAGLKTLNRLDQVMIKQEIQTKNALDGVVCDNLGNIIEACAANIFISKNGHWSTPCLKEAGVEGVMRQQILNQAAKSGIMITQKQISKNDLLVADAVCLTNALMGIIPVTKYEKHCYPSTHFTATKKLKNLLSKDSTK